MTPRLTGPRRGGRSFLVSVACHSARSFSFKALLSRPHSASTAPELRRQLRRVRAERDQLREELLNLEALYCRMVESRSLLFFEKEVRARACVCVCVCTRQRCTPTNVAHVGHAYPAIFGVHISI